MEGCCLNLFYLFYYIHSPHEIDKLVVCLLFIQLYIPFARNIPHFKSICTQHARFDRVFNVFMIYEGIL